MLQFWLCSAFAFVVVLINTSIECNTLTNQSFIRISRVGDKIFRTRQHRLVSFDADGDIRLDLDFTVPFITLPIQKSMDSAKTSLVNLNVGAMVLGGAVVFGAAVALPVLLAFFNKKGLIPPANPLNVFYNTRTGSQRSEDSQIWKYLTVLDRSLLDNDIDITTCSQRLTCWAVRNSSENVARGRASSADKIFDGMVSSSWFQENVLSPPLKEAVKFGLEREACSSMYRMCKLNYETVYYLVRYILDKFNSG